MNLCCHVRIEVKCLEKSKKLLLNRLGAADSGSFLRGCGTGSDSGTEGEALQLRIVFRTIVQRGTDICEGKE
jgi:hypothetical protein